MKYSLAKYIATISIPASVAASFGASSISVGGLGSTTESITISVPQDLWSVVGDATGGYVMNKNNDRSGSVIISLNQLTENVGRFITLCNVYYSSEEISDGLTIEVSSLDGKTVATCSDCMIRKIPDQAFAATAANQSWEFVCGKITFH